MKEPEWGLRTSGVAVTVLGALNTELNPSLTITFLIDFKREAQDF